MSVGGDDLFGQPLVSDPTVALPPLDIVLPVKSGPLHKVQFVIEFVGPRSIPAPAAAHLLGAEWYQALGQPQLHAMRPADLHWQSLTPNTDGSYDSLALSWDLISAKGTFSSASAQHLFQTAERFAPFIQRRAVPLPIPADVKPVVDALLEVRDALDIGFALQVYGPPQGYAERNLWVTCARLGLSFGSEGSFDWNLPGASDPLFSITPFGTTDAFSLAGVQSGLHHEGVTIGFHLPICPAPAQALQGCFHAAQVFSRDLGGQVMDDDGRKLNDRVKDELRGNLREAISLFARAGMTTGSPEARKLFAE